MLREIEEYKKLVSGLNGTINSFEKKIAEGKSDSLADNAPVMIWKSDVVNHCEYVNNARLEFTGRTFDEEISGGWFDMVHPDDIQRAMNIFNGAFEKKEKFQIECRHMRYDGQYRITLTLGVPRYDQDRTLLGYLWYCIDITDIKLVEKITQRDYEKQNVINSILNLSIENLSLREILQRTLMSVLNVSWLKNKAMGGIFLNDKENKNIILMASNNIGSFSAQKCAFIPLGECLCGIVAKTGQSQFAGCIDEQHTIRHDNMLPHGHYVFPICTADNKILGVLNVYLEENHIKEEFEVEFLGIVSRHLAQIILRKNAEDKLIRLSSAVEQTGDHIIIADRKGIIEYVNKAFEELTGFSRTDWIGKTPRILKSGKHDSDIYKKVWDTISCGQIFRGITINKKKNGELYYEEKAITPILDGNGKITHFVSVGRDITERIKAEEELHNAKEMAEKSEKLKGEFLAQMSHEIRTPVNTILNFASLLKYELEATMPEELSSMFAYIDSGGRRLIRTIDLILNMSQIQAETLSINKIMIDLGCEVLSDVVIELRPSANEKKLQLTYEDRTESAKICGDQYTIAQIFINIIDNAIKFTNTGEVKVILSEIDGYIIVEVIDTGIGISEDYLSNLFEPFSQEETGYTRRFEGNGLGLALVKKYVEVNNAEISVESKKEIGTKFTVRFKRQ
ncbi:MAG: PAS domain S-box protein [Ignavibacteria bacterium]